ncbi:MAG: alpha/beta fold hydrolase, partial [Myxococcales bacterium]
MIYREDRPLPEAVSRLYPFPRRYVDLEPGLRMHWAEAGAGEPILFVHGNPTWSFLWRRFVSGVADAGFRGVAPDHVGFGLSDKPLDDAYYSPERHVQNLTRFVEALDLRDLTLVVHDWGGPIGLGWAVRHPERVKRLVIFNTLAFPPKQKRAMSPFHLVFGSPLGSLASRFNLLVEVAMRFGVAQRAKM